MSRPNDDILLKFIQGQCNEIELTTIKAWLDESDDNARELFAIERMSHAVEADAIDEKQKQQALNRVEAIIRLHDANQLCTEQHHPTIWSLRHLLLYAAGLLFLIAIGATWLWGDARQMFTAQAPADSILILRLPDGSQVWLNKGSQLRYPSQFNNDERRVELQGEGYFEIAKDRAHPFIVNNELADVKVLGTRFNFISNKSEEWAEVSLIEGSVQVSCKDNESFVKLHPGQKALVYKGRGTIQVMNATAQLDAVWHDNLIPFTNANLQAIANTIERLYGVQIQLQTGLDLRRTYTGFIPCKSNIDSVLLRLQHTLPISYYIEGQKVFIRNQ